MGDEFLGLTDDERELLQMAAAPGLIYDSRFDNEHPARAELTAAHRAFCIAYPDEDRIETWATDLGRLALRVDELVREVER